MTVDEALGHADEWIKGVTVYDGLQGWRIACATLACEVRRLNAEIEAIGAGGVTGPLIARTVVKAADHFPDAGEMVPARWYMVDKIGMATLCSNRADAEQEAKDATLCYPHMAPHCAVLLAPGACELKTTNAALTRRP